ncbi:hypothetical protein AMTR_s00001p00253690 [Amborella trichopoda]|uniref:Uncharacterized protein n=1 Tax=Amborella trichopoda TaxID=13333 RepID=W1NKU7_AMBTC|nr:hypothetical protein AMTR_s00001p00253690 [Amborella trichopoda]
MAFFRPFRPLPQPYRTTTTSPLLSHNNRINNSFSLITSFADHLFPTSLSTGQHTSTPSLSSEKLTRFPSFKTRARFSFHIISSPKSLPLISPNDHWGTWTAIFSAGAFGLWSEKNTKIGSALSGALVSTLVALAASNLGIIGCEAPAYSIVMEYLLPLSVPLLLFKADLRRLVQSTGTLLLAFLLGSVATTIGTVVAYLLVPMRSLGNDSWKIAAALMSRHIGGAINYVAVAKALVISPSVLAAGLAADNVVCAIYFTSLFALASGIPPETTTLTNEQEMEKEAESGSLPVLQTATALALALAICKFGTFFTTLFGIQGGGIPFITAIVVLLATWFPQQIGSLAPAGEAMALILLQRLEHVPLGFYVASYNQSRLDISFMNAGDMISQQYVVFPALIFSSDIFLHWKPCNLSGAFEWRIFFSWNEYWKTIAGWRHEYLPWDAESRLFMVERDWVEVMIGDLKHLSLEILELFILFFQLGAFLVAQAWLIEAKILVKLGNNCCQPNLLMFYEFIAWQTSSPKFCLQKKNLSFHYVRHMYGQVFFAVVGANGSIWNVIKTAPGIFTFALIQVSIHLAVILGVGRLMGSDQKLLLIASNANVGGPTTACGMATTKGWATLIVPGILAGIFGISIATFLGIGFGMMVLKHM